jgi:hypothetical protein
MKGAEGMQSVPNLPQYPDRLFGDMGPNPLLSELWGTYRARILKFGGGELPNGRGGFYLHSSGKPVGTHGCIETQNNTDIFIRLSARAARLREWKIKLLVYPGIPGPWSPIVESNED